MPPHHPAHQRPTAQAAAVAEVVTPLIADALALERQLAACDRRAARAPFGSFAEQMRASAALLAARVREVGGRPHTRDSDGADDRAPAAPRGTAAGPADAPPARARPGDAVRQLLAHEDEVAGRLRRAIAACDARADERTASCLEEVLDEVEWQRSVLRELVPPELARPAAPPPGA